jgi:V8-like Glu-specific endopeptidase
MIAGGVPVAGMKTDPAGTAASEPEYKIAGGSQVHDSGRWPWIAALLDASVYKVVTGDDFFCGGSFVARDWVLTAAHCVYDIDSPGHLKIAAGLDNLSSIPGGTVFQVDGIYVHPMFNDHDSSTPDSDIALVHLINPVTGGEVIPMYRGNNSLDGMSAVAIGWGSTCGYHATSCSYRPEQLSEVELPIVDNDTCSAAAKKFSMPSVDETVICAGDGKGGRDTCEGDSGGPLLVNLDNRWVLAGITSAGMVDPCGTPGSYGLYSRVSEFLDFIDYYLMCVPVDGNLEISLPCVEYQGDRYSFRLSWSEDVSGLGGGWSIDGSSVQTVSGYQPACVPVEDDLEIPVCVDYQEHLYRFTLKPVATSREDTGYFWQIDETTLSMDAVFTPGRK